MTMLPGMGPNKVSFFDPAQQQEAKRKRAIADALMAKTQKFGENEMVSGHVLPISALERIGNVADQYTAYSGAKSADDIDANTARQRQELYQRALMGGNDPKEAARILAQDPESAKLAFELYGDALKGERADANWQRDADLQRELYGMKNSREDMQWEKEAQLKRELARMRGQGGGGQQIGEDSEGNPIYSPYSNKALPVGALKLQTEATDALAAAKSIAETSGLLSQQLNNGDLKVGPLENMISGARNWAGASSPNSQAFANMETALEKIRNDSLRLNKGVQTEGDAVRAMNEVIANKNDPTLLKNAMDKLTAINERGAELQRLQINQIRQNYNASPMDFEGMNALPSAVPQKPQGGKADQVRAYLTKKGMDPAKIEELISQRGIQ